MMEQIKEEKAFSCTTKKNNLSFTNLLHILIKQKEQTANKYKTENEQLHNLLLKQQDLLNKLNADNMALSRSSSNNNNQKSIYYSINDTTKLTREEYIILKICLLIKKKIN